MIERRDPKTLTDEECFAELRGLLDEYCQLLMRREALKIRQAVEQFALAQMKAAEAQEQHTLQ